MFESILAIVIISAAIGFAWYYMKKSQERREAEKAEELAQAQRDIATVAGLPAGERPLCEGDPTMSGDGQCLARDILDDGVAHNSKHVNSAFRNAYWARKDAGGSELDAFIAGMDAARWKSGSRGQVFDRIFSKTRLITESRRDELKRQAEAAHPSGYGAY